MKAYELALLSGDMWAAGRSQAILGRAKDVIGADLEAIPHYFEALHLLQQADSVDYFTQYTVSFNIAAIQHHFGHFDKSSSYYLSALDFLNKHLKTYPTEARKYRDDLLVYGVEYFLAQNEYRLGNLEYAARRLSTLLEAEAVPHKIKLNSLNKLGLILGEFEDFEKSIQSFMTIINDPKSDSLRVGRALHNVGVQYFKQAKYQAAIDWYKRAIAYKKHYANQVSLFYSYLDLGEAYLRLNQSEKSILTLEKALALELDITDHPDRFILHQFMGMAMIDIDPETAKGQLGIYNTRLSAYQKNADSLDIENKRREFNTVLENYLEQRGHKNEIQKKVRSFNRAGLVFSFVVLFLLLSTVLLMLRKDKIKRRQFHQQMIETGNSH